MSATLAGVIGWPIHQSLSPILHTYWLKHYGLKGAYVPLAIRPEHFAACAATLPLMGFAGASVTVPHKEAAFALAGSRDADAEATGAVNTLVFENTRLRGMNTDVVGFAAALREDLGVEAASAGPVTVLGAGGAARGVVLALLRQGAPEIRLVNRTQARAEALARSFGAKPVKAAEWGDWERVFGDARLLVNTTSLGMIGKEGMAVPLDALPKEAAVADIVYNPLETELLREARLSGHRTMGGLGMLMHQAVPAFAAWFGVTPEVTPALRAELKGFLRG